VITVYASRRCPHCRALLEDLERRHVAHVLVDVDSEPARLADVVGLTWEPRLPAVVDHERWSIGFRGGSSTFADLGLQSPGRHL
jgi:glutaredoxin